VNALLVGFWGFVGVLCSLVGALLGLYAGASQRVISVVMAVGAGVLISLAGGMPPRFWAVRIKVMQDRGCGLPRIHLPRRW
jgi:hypothetical protein